MTSGPTVKMNGVGIRFDWPEHALYLTLDRFRESGGSTRAELTAFLNGDTPRILTQGMVNLTSLQGRASFARRLAELHPAAPWDEVLETAAVHGLKLRRQGEPVVALSAAEPLVPVSYSVNPLCFEGHPSLIFSDGGTGKSWVALLAAVLVDTGTTVGNALRALPGRSLVLDWEQDRSVFNERLCHLARAHGEWAQAGPLYKRMLAPLADDAQAICKTIDDEGVTLVVLDSMGPAAGGDICSAETAMRTMQAIRSLGVTVLCTAHVSKGSERLTPFGSVFFRNLSRSAWRLESTQEGDTLRLVLVHDKSNFGRLREPFGLALQFGDNAVSVTPFDPEDIQTLPLPNRIRNLLESDGVPRSSQQIADELDAKPASIKAVLSKHKGYKWSMIGEGREARWTVLRSL